MPTTVKLRTAPAVYLHKGQKFHLLGLLKEFTNSFSAIQKFFAERKIVVHQFKDAVYAADGFSGLAKLYTKGMKIVKDVKDFPKEGDHVVVCNNDSMKYEYALVRLRSNFKKPIMFKDPKKQAQVTFYTAWASYKGQIDVVYVAMDDAFGDAGVISRGGNADDNFKPDTIRRKAKELNLTYNY